MKKIYLFILTLSALCFCACDSNKEKVEELADQFIVAFNDGDKAAIYELLPTIKTCENLSISGSIGQGNDISVVKEDSTGNYIVTINEQKQQRLVFAVDSVEGVKMIDTYGVFRLDSIANELALKTGLPVKKISDLKLAFLMNPQSDFINDLKLTKNTDYLWAKYGAYSWSRTNSGFDVSMNFNVSNNSTQTINGKDYYLYITPKQVSTGKVFNSKTVEGVDIAPNEVREFNVSEPYLYNYASQRDLSYTVEVKYRSESILSFLLNYGNFDGKEYEDFIAHPYRAKVKERGTYGRVSAEKVGVAYAYKEMSDKSKVVDTLYHRKGICLVWETESWASVFTYDEVFIGYVKAEEIDTSPNGKDLDLAEMKLKSANGKVNVYDCSQNASKDKVVKTISANQKVLLELFGGGEEEDYYLYERQPNGSMKKIGRINPENIDFEEE
jgi:hypothetical protein